MPLSIDPLTTVRRYLPLATACALLMLCALAAVAHAEWGELGHAEILGPKVHDVSFTSSTSVLAFAADSADSSYYIGDEPNEGEFRIQRFVEGKAEASISFTPPEPKKVHDGIGETGVGLQLAVDSANNRVYALVLYKRRNQSPKELKEEEEEANPYEHLPLDSEEHAAGELYAFELTSGKLVSVKENAESKPAPIIGESAFADQGELPKEALLNPRGMAVDPKSGDLVILGIEDEELDEKVEKEEAEKQCRAAAQFVTRHCQNGQTHRGETWPPLRR